MNSPNTLTATAIVALGGGVGAMLRYHAGRAVTAFSGPNTLFPWGTFLINVSGSLLMGLLAGWLARQDGSESLRLLLGVGVLGGFTTFSSFSLDTIALIERGSIGTALGYVLVSVIGSILAVFVGLTAVRVAA